MKSFRAAESIVRTFRALADDPTRPERLLLDGAHLVRDAHEAGACSKCWSWPRHGCDSAEEKRIAGCSGVGVDVIAAEEKVFAA